VTRQTETGSAGEAFVAGRLERAGYRILDRNWRVRGGELDLVALDGETLVFVEVKVRSGGSYTTAEDSLDWRQLNRLMVAAERYVQQHEEHYDRVWRVDLVAVTLSRDGAVRRYNHYQNLTEG
jgi:putative endonuclease